MSKAAQTTLQTVSLEQRPDLKQQMDELGWRAWPEFMLYDPVPGACWTQLQKTFAAYQLLLLDAGEAVAIVNSLPLRFDQPLGQLPDRGVDWGLERSLEDHAAGYEPNCLMAVQIVIAGDRQGQGLSRTCVQETISLASARNIGRVIVPLRPASKHNFPLIPFDQYIGWKNADGLPYDGWLRVHVKMGATIIRSCPESMYIPGTIEQWKKWTGLEFPGSGAYIVPGALNPVEIDLERDLGEYTEPNLWLLHETS